MAVDVVAGFRTGEEPPAGLVETAVGVRGTENAESRRAQPLVRWFRNARGIRILTSGVLAAYRMAVGCPHSAREPQRHPTPEKRLITAGDVVGGEPAGHALGGQGARE